MTSNALRAQELRETKRNNNMRNEVEKQKDRTNRRGQDFKAGADALNFIGGVASTAAKSLNDYTWYARNDKVAQDIASIPWGNRTGAPINIPFDAFKGMPGILRLNLLPSVGVSDSAFSGINIAARQLFVENRSQNTSYTVYEPVDYMQYNICLGSIYAAYGMCTLILGLLQTYSAENAYMPKGIINSMGGDFEDMVSKIPNFRAWLNNFGRRVESSFAAPSNIPYFKRMLMLFSHIYTDEMNTDKGQIYYAWPSGLFRWNEEAGIAQISNFPSSWNYNSLVHFVENLYAGLSLMESANIMAGDTRKAFSDLFKFPEIPENHKSQLEYDQFMLEQFRNATLKAPMTGLSLGGLNITQDNSQLVYTPYYYVAAANATGDTPNYFLADTEARLITVSNPHPTYVDTLECTRWHYRLKSPTKTDSEIRAYFETCGTEIAVNCQIFVSDGMDNMISKDITTLGVAVGGVIADVYMWLAALKHFKYAPCVDLCTTLSDGQSGTPRFARYQNIDNWAILATETLAFMNESVMLDEFMHRQ